MTESMFDLGFGEYLVGITDYCTQPANGVAKLPRVGGTKNARFEDIVALQPDLVLANQEENSRELVEKLEAARIPVWVTFPKTVRQAMDVLWALVGIYKDRNAATRLEILEITLDWVETARKEETQIWRYFCPIWQETPTDRSQLNTKGWWMVFNQDTYPSDLLRLLGGENIFAQRKRKYPLDADLGLAPEQPAENRDTRYPRVDWDEVNQANPEVILLPNEPFPFTQEHQEWMAQLFPGTFAAQKGQILMIDGSLITWHGTRLARALQELPILFSGIEAETK